MPITRAINALATPGPRDIGALIKRLGQSDLHPQRFATRLGSVYVQLPNGSTVRYKSPHLGHANDAGWQSQSDWTGFVDEDAANALSLVQARGPSPLMLIRDTDTPRLAVASADVMRPIRGTVVEYARHPRLDSIPVETWLDRSHHFGNRVIAVEPEPNWADWLERAARNAPPPRMSIP